MKDSVGNWIAEPPAYEPIVAEGNKIMFGLIYILLVSLNYLIFKI